MNGKMRATTGLINLLAFICTFAGNDINGELLPENVPLSQSVSNNPLMPNDEQSVRDCPYTNFPYAKRGLASSIFAEQYQDKTFAHVVKLDTVEESSCVGIIVDQSHILTTKQCAQKEPQTISFQNVTLPRWGILNTKYHLSLDVAIIQLKTNLSIDKQITPACLWTGSTSNGFSRVQRVSRDYHTGGLTISSTECKIGGRAQCFENAKKASDGFLQVQAVSNYRQHPFLIALGSDADGSLLEVSSYWEWIQTETGSSVDPIECAVRYFKLREYDDRVATVHRSDKYQSIQLMNAYVAPSVNNGYKVLIGHYVEDPVKETVVTYSCYGTLIHRNFVLTTASCIDGFKNEALIVEMKQDRTYRLSSDPNFLLKAQSQYLEQVTVAEVFLHPNFSISPLHDDLALLLLDPVELKFDTNFKPACLWTYDSIKIEAFQTNGHGPQRTVENLEERVELLLQDRSETELYLISKVLEDCPFNLTRNQMCVGETGTLVPGTCKSNLGSAMSREIGIFHSFYYDYVFAINSKGDECGINVPSTFTKVAPYVKWIDSIIFGENVEFNNSDIYYGDECKLRGGSTGVCLTVEECPGIVDDLMTGDAANLEHCGFMKGDIMVCCSSMDSAPSNLPSTDLNELVKEIDQCPELYSDLRKGRSPYNFWKGEETFLGLIKSNSSSNTCDATLIAKNFVITSASCYKRFSQDEQLSVKIGSNNVQHSGVEKVVVHPLHEANSHENNLAVLKLKNAVTVSEESIPACLWNTRSHIPFALEIIGTTNNEVFKVPAYPLYQKRCEKQRFSNLTSTELCAAHEGSAVKENSMICHDAGSGIYNYYAHGLYESQVSYLVGIYTRGTDCEDSAVGIFTRISHHFGWIKSVIYRNF
ncbi:uncharacterized protein LOC135700425 [Ochlerotatus camptorhynchus]|uniref:uncharacterized protein LOC135700425 n=1 Tax=Ochlerotatus camptorhynchus TaxID=644619 RepID=UPI0031DE28A3